MKKIFFLVVMLGIFKVSQAQITFQKTYGGTGFDQGNSVQQTNDGGFIVAGYTKSFGAGGKDVYLVKTASDGTLEWAKTYGGTGDDSGNYVQQTSDGGFIIAGQTNSFGVLDGVYLVKTASDGALQWAKTFGGDIGYAVQQTNDGGFIITGEAYYLGPGYLDVYLIKTASNGALQWTKTFGGTDGEYGNSVQQSNDGGFIIAGYTGSFGVDGEVYLVKTKSDGSLEWAKTFGGTGAEYGCSVQQTNDGGFIISGITWDLTSLNQNADVYIVKTSSDGTLQWTKTFGDTTRDQGYSIQQTNDGGFIIIGFSISFGFGDPDCYLIKTDSAGNQLWSKTFVGASLDIGYSIQQTNDGGFIITGGPQTAKDDVFLIKTDSNGNSGTVIYCYETAVTSIVGSLGVEGSTATQTGSGGTEGNPATQTGTGGVETAICTTDGVHEPENLNSISLSPNPFSTETTISVQNSKFEVQSFILYDVFGRAVKTLNFEHGAHNFKLERGNLGSGIYFYKVSGDGNVLGTGKVIVE